MVVEGGISDVCLLFCLEVRYAEDKNALLAAWLYNSMVGMGTRDKSLMQLVLGRCEVRRIRSLLATIPISLVLTAEVFV